MSRCIALLVVLAAAVYAQRFEVATLKPSDGTSRGAAARALPGGERYVATNASLKDLITVAYRLRHDQVSGGPGWMGRDRYDLNAKAERPSTVDELRVMLQNLLAERFQLEFHRAPKEGAVYFLSVDNGGPKLKAGATTDSAIDIKQLKPFHMQWTGTAASMDDVAWRLCEVLDRPVVNRTELKGGYDFELSYTADVPAVLAAGTLINGEPLDISGPRVFEALRKQLGLRLDAGKAAVDAIVVDRAEKPAAN